MDALLRSAQRSATHDPAALAHVGARLVRLGRLDPVQGAWLADVAAQSDGLRWSPLRVARSIRQALGPEALCAGLVALTRVACENAELPFSAARQTLDLCSRALIQGLAGDEQLEIERLRSKLVQFTEESLDPRMLAALWCVIRVTHAVERARTFWAWSRAAAILRSARGALPGRGQARRLRGALVSGVLDLFATLDQQFPPWGTLWVEERPVTRAAPRRGALALGCEHPRIEGTSSYRLVLELDGRWLAVTPTLRRCCLATRPSPGRAYAHAGAAARVAGLADRGLDPARAQAVFEATERLLGGGAQGDAPLLSVADDALGTWKQVSEQVCGAPVRVARRLVMLAQAPPPIVGDDDDLPF